MAGFTPLSKDRRAAAQGKRNIACVGRCRRDDRGKAQMPLVLRVKVQKREGVSGGEGGAQTPDPTIMSRVL